LFNSDYWDGEIDMNHCNFFQKILSIEKKNSQWIHDNFMVKGSMKRLFNPNSKTMKTRKSRNLKGIEGKERNTINIKKRIKDSLFRKSIYTYNPANPPNLKHKKDEMYIHQWYKVNTCLRKLI